MTETEVTVVEEQAVVEKPVDEFPNTSARIVMIWVKVQDLEGRPFFVRQVRALEKGIELVKRIRAKGITAGWDYSFRGRHLSTKAQVRLMYAFLKSKDIQVV